MDKKRYQELAILSFKYRLKAERKLLADSLVLAEEYEEHPKHAILCEMVDEQKRCIADLELILERLENGQTIKMEEMT